MILIYVSVTLSIKLNEIECLSEYLGLRTVYTYVGNHNVVNKHQIECSLCPLLLFFIWILFSLDLHLHAFYYTWQPGDNFMSKSVYMCNTFHTKFATLLMPLFTLMYFSCFVQ